MKNISSIQKCNKIETPKTPGGISKSLLTPCRRVGLSRNWRRSGPSPFVSPLSSSDSPSTEVKQLQSKKRKCTTEEASTELSKNDVEDTIENTPCVSPCTIVHGEIQGNYTENTQTPTRSLLPRKKSKTLILAKECDEENENVPLSTLKPNVIENEVKVDDSPILVKVNKLSRSNSKSKSKLLKSPIKSINVDVEVHPLPICITSIGKETSILEVENNLINNINAVKKSPENLTKECIVVIQKKIFKTNNKSNSDKDKPNKPISQTLFDSDTDDVPLSNLNKEKVLHEDDEFQDMKPVKKLSKTPSSELKPTNKVKEKSKPLKSKMQDIKTDIKHIKPAQVFDVEDDDFAPGKKTILVKKTYKKVSQPSKARSTGSISQKDIDELMARIEIKKNLLLAKAMTNETSELRNLIKKWQRGCQDALTELLELMKTKAPEQNMSYAEMLQILKIPPDLVGYDSDNDCFNSPDDASIVLSDFTV